MLGRRFTGLIHFQNPHMRSSIEFWCRLNGNKKFPLAMVITLSRDILDHTSLLLDTGRASSSGNHPLFKFELGWLLHDGFVNMVKEIWESVSEKKIICGGGRQKLED
jgi:hypothetical protein